MMERFRTRPRGAVLGVCVGDSGRKTINGNVLLMMLAEVVKISVEGWIKKNDESKIICGVERSNEADATSYAARNQFNLPSIICACSHRLVHQTSRQPVPGLSMSEVQQLPPTILNVSRSQPGRQGSPLR